MRPHSPSPDNRGTPEKIICLEAGNLRESEYNRGTGCGNTARPGLCGGCRATGIPTADRAEESSAYLLGCKSLEGKG